MIKYCSLYSGSSGNSHFIGKKNTNILIDAGLSGKKIKEALEAINEDPSHIDGIIISHEHSDHTKGIGVLSRRYKIPIYGNQTTIDNIKHLLTDVPDENINVFTTKVPFEIKDFIIVPFPIPHDAGEPVGFSIIGDYKKITIATDIGYIADGLVKYLENSNILLLEANHDIEMLRIGSYPWYLKQRILSDIGHLSNEAAGAIVAKIVKAGCTKVILGHLSKENNFPELAYETVKVILKEQGINVQNDLELSIAARDTVGTPIVL